MTPDDERLLALMTALGSRAEYATGEAPFPAEVTRGDAAAIAADLHLAVDRAVEWREAEVVRKGQTLACRAGCASCCDQLVGVWAGEAELVAGWLDEPEHAAERAAFAGAYPRWLERSRESIARVAERTRARDDRGQALALAAHWRLGIPCALNRDGLCSVYAVRPAVCRTCHALETSERCVPDDETGSAASIMHFVPLERLLDKTRALSRAVHHALGGAPEVPLALCEAVAARLGL